MRRKHMAVLLAVCSLGAGSAGAATDPLLGLWMVKDERDGSARALIRITERDGEFIGTIEAGLRGGVGESKVCVKCADERQGQPLLGMTILSGIRKLNDRYDGGRILDPDTGREYRCQLTLQDEGQRLQVRGYLGSPLIGSTRTWYRHVGQAGESTTP